MNRNITALVFLTSLVGGISARADQAVRDLVMVEQNTHATVRFGFECDDEKATLVGTYSGETLYEHQDNWTTNEMLLLPRAKEVAGNRCKIEHKNNVKAINAGIQELIKPSETSTHCLSPSQVRAKVWGLRQEAAELRDEAEDDRAGNPSFTSPAAKKIFQDNFKNLMRQAQAKENQAKALEKHTGNSTGDCAIASNAKTARPSPAKALPEAAASGLPSSADAAGAAK